MRARSALLAVGLILCGCAHEREVYPTAMTVTSTAPFLAVTSTGIEYELTLAPEDIEAGDVIATIMDTRGTADVMDDIAISMRYVFTP